MRHLEKYRRRAVLRRELAIRGVPFRWRKGLELMAGSSACGCCDYFSNCENKGYYKPRKKDSVDYNDCKHYAKFQ